MYQLYFYLIRKSVHFHGKIKVDVLFYNKMIRRPKMFLREKMWSDRLNLLLVHEFVSSSADLFTFLSSTVRDCDSSALCLTIVKYIIARWILMRLNIFANASSTTCVLAILLLQPHCGLEIYFMFTRMRCTRCIIICFLTIIELIIIVSR